VTKFYIDSANLDDIRELWKWGCFAGVTTNNLLMLKEGLQNEIVRRARLKEIEDIIGTTADLHADYVDARATELANPKIYPNQLGEWDCTDWIVNVTGVTSSEQLPLIMATQADFVSLLWGRAEDGGTGNGSCLLRKALEYKKTFGWGGQIIVGSVRTVGVAIDAIDLGADIITAAPKIYREMLRSDATDRFQKECEEAQR